MFAPSMNHAVAIWSAWVRQRLANSILNAFSLCGLASRKAASAALRKFAWSIRLADERGFGLGRSPWLGPDAAQRDPCSSHFPARDRDHDGRRCQSELVGRAVAQLQIDLPASRDGRWECDVRDEVAWFEHGFAIRCAAGQKMKVTDGDRTRTPRSLHMDRRFQCRHRHAHVRWIGCDAVFAGA